MVVYTFIWIQITKNKLGYYTRLNYFLTLKKIHAAAPLRITRYIAFWPLAATPATTTIFILFPHTLSTNEKKYQQLTH